MVSGAVLRDMFRLWNRYYYLALQLLQASDKRRQVSILSEFSTRSAEVCKHAQENLCDILQTEVYKKGLKERQERCRDCPLVQWCAGSVHSTVMKIHRLERLALENPKPWSDKILLKAKDLAQDIVADRQNFIEFEELARQWR